MIARGFSLTVLFTAYKTTLVWWWSLSRSLHWSTRCYVWVMSLSVLWGGEFHTLSTLTGQSSGGMYCSPSMNSRSRTSTTWCRCCFSSIIIGYRFFLLLLISSGYCSLMPKEDPFNLYAFCSTICRWLWYITRDTLIVPRRPNRWMIPNSIYHNWTVLKWEFTTKNRKNTTILLIECMDLHKYSIRKQYTINSTHVYKTWK